MGLENIEKMGRNVLVMTGERNRKNESVERVEKERKRKKLIKR